MKLAIVQTKPRKGEFERNLASLGEAFAQLAADRRNGAPDVAVLPEAALTGYFLEGGVYEAAFPANRIAERMATTWRNAAGDAPIEIAFGFFENAAGTYHNSAMYLRVERGGHTILHVHRKLFLPTYGVFDEARFFSRGRSLEPFEARFGRTALLLCEDAWHAIVPTIAAIKGARLLIIPSASPGRGFAGSGEVESVERWRSVLRMQALEHGVFVVYAGLAGFEGGKGMSGSSCVVNPSGECIASAPLLGAHIVRAELDLSEIDRARARFPSLGDLFAVLPDLAHVL
jgi:N-carbamoylputrescine amidase